MCAELLCDPRDCSPPGFSAVGFSRQEYWSGLPFSCPRDLPNSGIKPTSPVSPALQVDSLPTDSSGKTPILGRLKQKEKGVAEDEVVTQHHQLNGHESEQILEDSERQGSLACCNLWGCEESDMT